MKKIFTLVLVVWLASGCSGMSTHIAAPKAASTPEFRFEKNEAVNYTMDVREIWEPMDKILKADPETVRWEEFEETLGPMIGKFEKFPRSWKGKPIDDAYGHSEHLKTLYGYVLEYSKAMHVYTSYRNGPKFGAKAKEELYALRELALAESKWEEERVSNLEKSAGIQ